VQKAYYFVEVYDKDILANGFFAFAGICSIKNEYLSIPAVA
jgi:hypothetical protein